MSFSKPISTIAIFLIAALALAAVPSQAEEKYVHPSWGWSFSLPDNWDVAISEKYRIGFRTSGELPDGGFSVLIHPSAWPGFEKHIDLDPFLKKFAEGWVSDRRREFEAKGTSVEVFPGKKMTLANGIPAFEVEMDIGTFFVDREKWVSTMVGGRGVMFMVKSSKGSWDELSPDFERILKSFSTEAGAQHAAESSR